MDVSTTVIIPTVGRTFFALNMVMMLVAGTRQPDEIIIVDQTDADQRNAMAGYHLTKATAANGPKLLFLVSDVARCWDALVLVRQLETTRNS